MSEHTPHGAMGCEWIDQRYIELQQQLAQAREQANDWFQVAQREGTQRASIEGELIQARALLEDIAAKPLTQQTAEGPECLYCEALPEDGNHFASCIWMQARAFLAQQQEPSQ